MNPSTPSFLGYGPDDYDDEVSTVATGAPAGKRIIIFVDDLNMPKLDTYGSQPPIELLRQYQDFGGLYDREKLFWKEINVSILL